MSDSVPSRKIKKSDFKSMQRILETISDSISFFNSIKWDLTIGRGSYLYELFFYWHTELGFMQSNKITSRINTIFKCFNDIISYCNNIVERANEIIKAENEVLTEWRDNKIALYEEHNMKAKEDENDTIYVWDVSWINDAYCNDYINDRLKNSIEGVEFDLIDNQYLSNKEMYHVDTNYVAGLINNIKSSFKNINISCLDDIIDCTNGTTFCSEINSYFVNIFDSANDAQDIVDSSILHFPYIITGALAADDAISKSLGDEVWNKDTDISSVVKDRTYEQYEKYINEEEEKRNALNLFCKKWYDISNGTHGKNGGEYSDDRNSLKFCYGMTDEEIDSYLSRREIAIEKICAGRLLITERSEIAKSYNITADEINARMNKDTSEEPPTKNELGLGDDSNEDKTGSGGTQPSYNFGNQGGGNNSSSSSQQPEPPAVKLEETQPETPPEEDPGTTEPETPPEEDPGITEPETPPEEDPGTTEPETPPEEDPGTTEPETPPEEDPGTTEPEIGGESDWEAVTDEEGNIPEPEVTTGEDTFTPPEETGDTTITEPNADGSEPILDQNGDVQQPEIDDTVSDEGDIVSPAPEEGEPVVSENDDVQMPKVGDTGAIEDDMVNPTLDEPNISEDKLVSPLLDDENAVISDATSDIAESTTDALNEATADADVAELNSNVLENDPSMENMMSSNDKDSSFDLELDNVDPLDVNPIEDDFDFNAMMEGIDDKIGFSRLDIPKPDGSIPVPKDPTIKDM